MFRQYGVFIFLLIICCLISVCGCTNPGVPKVEKGVLDLRQWSFDTDGNIRLHGKWAFYWKQLIEPASLENTGIPDALADVPGVWNGLVINGETLGGTGYGTYRLTVLLPPGSHILSLKLSCASSAMRVFADGREIVAQGIPGPTPEENHPQYLPGLVDVTTRGPSLDLVVHVSNFHHWQGGLWEPLVMGSHSGIRQLEKQVAVRDFFLLGAITIMGLYQLVFFLYRRQEKASLYFGLFCLMAALRLMVTEERYLLQFMGGMDFHLLMVLTYTSFYLSVPFFVLYVRALFPKDISHRFSRVVLWMGIGFSLLGLTLPPRPFSMSMPLYQIISLALVVGYGGLIAVRLLVNRRKGAVIFVSGFIILAAAVVNDLLYSRLIIVSVNMAPAGLLAFAFTQVIILSRRFSHAFSTIERQAGELAHANAAYAGELAARTETEKALKASEEQYRRLIQESPVGICIVRDERIQYANTRLLEVVGISWAEIKGAWFLELVHPGDRAVLMDRYCRRIKGEALDTHITIRTLLPDGRTRELEAGENLVQWQDKSAVLFFLRDITEQKQTREMLVQSEKMLSVGGLAAGMAHEINNPLAGMIQSAQVMRNRIRPGLPVNDKAARAAGTDMNVIADYMARRKVPDLLENICEAGKAAAGIVDNMLSFSRKSGQEKQPRELIPIVDKTLSLLSSDFTLRDKYDFKNIFINKEVVPGLKPALCEESKIQQVLLNLFKNAAQAMGGTINGSPTLFIRFFQEGDMACISIRDNGPGMEATVRRRIFEPFYTTKDVNSGTGLGLSISYFIITEDHGGSLSVASEPGMGTEFIIRLPSPQELN